MSRTDSAPKTRSTAATMNIPTCAPPISLSMKPPQAAATI